MAFQTAASRAGTTRKRSMVAASDSISFPRFLHSTRVGLSESCMNGLASTQPVNVTLPCQSMSVGTLLTNPVSVYGIGQKDPVPEIL
mmetsp:Transcript_26794/g.62269  ORF Transcript_26794/g.62269 Transcript_26794/m.62269 type:complete len:87 (-) Transcript_26794:139-399(-)